MKRASIAATLILVLGLLACTGEDTGTRAPESSTPTETPAVEATDCPATEEVCSYSLQVADAIARADFGGLRSMLLLSSFTCPGPEAGGLGGPYPLCDGAAAGEVRKGMRTYHLNSHGTVEGEPLSEVRLAVLAGWQFPDHVVAAQPAIVGLHCPISGTAANCDDRFVLFLAGATHFHIVRAGATYGIDALQLGHFAEGDAVFDAGGDLKMAGASGVEEGRFYPWRPAQGDNPPETVRAEWLMAPAEISGVVVEPREGGCPATVAVRVPEAALAADPKGPEVVEVWLYDGPIGLGDQLYDGTRSPEKVLATPGSKPHEFEIRLEASMLAAKLCSAETVGMVVWGSTGPHVAGYRISAP